MTIQKRTGLLLLACLCVSLQGCGNKKAEDVNAADPSVVVKNDGRDLFIVQRSGKFGFINAQGQIVIEPQFDGAMDFSEGLAAVCVGTCTFVKSKEKPDDFAENVYEGKFGFIDTQGKMVINPQFTDAGPFRQGLAHAATGTYELIDGPKYGYIDATGKFVIPEQFESKWDFDESGLTVACVGELETRRCGYIDRSGKYLINPQFFNAFPFVRGSLAPVLEKGDYTVSYIDRTGKIMWKGEPAPPEKK